ncbi:MAG: beta family protein [Pyrinomonadaceae bacterium]
MKFMFDHTHYVPVLRLKGAEKGALRYLVPGVRARITPLLELVSTKNNSPRKIADDVRRSWGPAPFLLDDLNYPESTDGNALVRFISAMRSHGLQSIPVTGLNRAREHQNNVAGIIATDGRGACFRLNLEDLREPFLTADLNDLLIRLRLRPEQVDLIVDYEVLPVFSLLYTELCQRLPYVGQWRTFTVVGGAFCQDLTEYEKNRQYTRPRDDWYFWQSQVTVKLPRTPTYGDYSIQFGFYKEPPRRANVSASIRYTSHDYWVIMRGEGLRNEGGPILF